LVARGLDEVANRRVVLVTRVLEEAVLRIELERERGLPRPREHDRVLDLELVVDPLGCDTREPLDEAQRLARRDRLSAGADDRHRALAVEVRRLDHERVALEAAARFAEPLPNR